MKNSGLTKEEWERLAQTDLRTVDPRGIEIGLEQELIKLETTVNTYFGKEMI